MIGDKMFDLCHELWPINRSLSGEGVRETLKILQRETGLLKIKSFKSGQQVFDWVIPKEWEIKQAYITTPTGEKICDFSKNNLSLVGYSTSVDAELDLDELQENLHSLPDQPNAIPYVTSYYNDYWGFCIPYNQRKNLAKGKYSVFIESRKFKGELNYGEVYIPGKIKKEVFLSTYVCHPSMANNELSGPVVASYLIKWVQEKARKYSYRIIFIPETIGAIAYIHKNLKHLKKNIIAGYNVTCVGDDRTYSYLPSRNGKTLSDTVAKNILKNNTDGFKQYEWIDRASDERQYCSPGVDLPIASIMRSKYGEYPEYHTSLDNLSGDLVNPKGLQGGYDMLRMALEAIEINGYPKANFLCEPQLGKRGLFNLISVKGSQKEYKFLEEILTWADGQTSLVEIADKLNVCVLDLKEAMFLLESNNLVTLFDEPEKTE